MAEVATILILDKLPSKTEKSLLPWYVVRVLLLLVWLLAKVDDPNLPGTLVI